jgi:predicted nucleic acid-binding protein
VTSDRVVFDAEPLVAHADDEPGSASVATALDAVAIEETAGYVNYVTLAEVRYVLGRKYDTAVADEYVDWLLDLGIVPIDAEAVWAGAAEVVIAHNPALGDAFARATADHLDATLLAGTDDYDDLTDVPIDRFRDEPA